MKSSWFYDCTFIAFWSPTEASETEHWIFQQPDVYIDCVRCKKFYTMGMLPIVIVTISTSGCQDLWNVNKYRYKYK